MFGEIEKKEQNTYGTVFNIEHYHVHDGEGIRTNVFLKGCNLWCQWCCNPESQRMEPQVAVYQNICKKCYTCMRVCPIGAISIGSESTVVIDRSSCTKCGICAEKCPHDALELFGKRMSVAEVIREVERDVLYYINSEGGMTLSGGEPLMQSEFARELLLACKRRYIDTAIETAGAVSWNRFWQVAQYADTILFDLKYTNEKKFSTICREPLKIVKENLKKLVENNKHVVIRCPIIPEYNDDDGHIDSIISWAKECGIKEVDILAFHQLGSFKYRSLNMEYKLWGVEEMKMDKMRKIQDKMTSAGLKVTIGG